MVFGSIDRSIVVVVPTEVVVLDAMICIALSYSAAYNSLCLFDRKTKTEEKNLMSITLNAMTKRAFSCLNGKEDAE